MFWISLDKGSLILPMEVRDDEVEVVSKRLNEENEEIEETAKEVMKKMLAQNSTLDDCAFFVRAQLFE